MSNVLTALAPVLYSAAAQVQSEPFAAVTSIDTSFDDKGVAKGDTVYVPVAPARAATDFTPGNVTSTGDDSTATSVGIQITASKKVSWNLTGEQMRSLENGGTNTDWVSQLVKQGMRTLRNLAESDAVAAIAAGASRAYGTAGTTPFASDMSELPNLLKILKDNGAPLADPQIIMNTAAGLNLRKLGIYQQAYQAGTDEERRSGRFLPQFGFALHESAGVGVHTAGTGSGYLVNDASTAVGDTTVTADTGTGTVLAGDVVTFASDTNKYVVGSPLASGSFGLNQPGLLKAPADNAAISLGASYTGNVAFERSAVVGVIRPPLIPENPTIQQLVVSDGNGMSYLMLDISQYGQRSWEIHLAWGFKAIMSQYIALLLG